MINQITDVHRWVTENYRLTVRTCCPGWLAVHRAGSLQPDHCLPYCPQG